MVASNASRGTRDFSGFWCNHRLALHSLDGVSAEMGTMLRGEALRGRDYS
jgi:hypothetical protein